MPNTRITKQRLSDHMSYSKKMYIIGTICALLIAGLMFDVTRHNPTGPQLMQIALVDSYCDTAKLDDDLPALLEKAQQRDDRVEQVSFLSVAYSGNSSDDYYGAQVYMVQLYAGDNDIWIQNEALMNDLMNGGGLVPLENLDGYEAFTLKYPDVKVVWADEPGFEIIDEDEPISVPQHAYAFEAGSMLGFNTRGAFDVRGMYIMIPTTTTDYETAFATLADLFDTFTPAEEAGAANG